MKFLQKLGKALMLPVAVLPICGILMGIVMVAGQTLVTPTEASYDVMTSSASFVPSHISAPLQPWKWISTSPGIRYMPSASTTASSPAGSPVQLTNLPFSTAASPLTNRCSSVYIFAFLILMTYQLPLSYSESLLSAASSATSVTSL
jgi:hypothetical protein